LSQALFVVHGVGTGQMKKATLAHLKTHVLVDSFHPQEGNGGDGCTVVNLKQL
jgi:dsDNA-specific endonuclease/ATPase MutS2